jgi:hypothetical protein
MAVPANDPSTSPTMTDPPQRPDVLRFSAECESGHCRVAVVVSEAQAFGSVTPCRPFVDGWPFCVVPALG